MKNDRRSAPRWHAAGSKMKAEALLDDGAKLDATIVDVSATGIGLRTDRKRFRIGMTVRLELALNGEKIPLRGSVRFVDRFYPRVGLLIDAPERMGQLVEFAAASDFVMTEVANDCLIVNGRLTHAAIRMFESLRACRTLDLSGVNYVSMGGASIVFGLTQAGMKIKCCSPAIAPFFNSLGICCGARLCVARVPCDLPKRWPTDKNRMAALAAA